MKICPFEHLLLSYVQNELSREKYQQLQSHLASCQHCQEIYADFKSIDEKLVTYEREPAPRQLYLAYTKELKALFKPTLIWHNRFRVLKTFFSQLFISRTVSFRLARAFFILACGIFVGRFLFLPSQTPRTNLAVSRSTHMNLTKDDIQFISDYAIKSELLLLTIANSASDEPSDDDIFLNKDIAQTLLYKTAQVQAKARALDDEVILVFLNHLELVLLEISNRDDDEVRSVFREIKGMVQEADMVQKSRQLQHLLDKILLESA